MNPILMTAHQIYLMASFAGLAVAPPNEEDSARNYKLEFNVPVDGVTEPFYLSDAEYPEEGGTVLRTEPAEGK